MILDLIEIATVGALPFIENINTIVGFAEYLKTGFKYFIGNKVAAYKVMVSHETFPLNEVHNGLHMRTDSEAGNCSWSFPGLPMLKLDIRVDD